MRATHVASLLSLVPPVRDQEQVIFTETTHTSEHPADDGVAPAAGPAHVSKIGVFLAVFRRSGPHLIEASLIPTALFYSFLVIAGLGAAYAVALLWLYAAVAVRLLRHRPVPPLLVLGAIGITVRTTVAVASDSAFLYFAQPVLGSLAMGCVFLASVLFGRPMVERLALEFWPLTPEMLSRPTVIRLLRGLTFLWGGVNLAIGAATLSMLLWMPLATYVALKPVATYVITGLGVAVTIDLAVRLARREGFLGERPGQPVEVPA